MFRYEGNTCTSALTYFISMSHGRQCMQQVWLQYCRDPLQSPHGWHDDVQMSPGQKIKRTATLSPISVLAKTLE
jgi:hypothetical protein